MNQPLSVNPDGVKSLSDIHQQVAGAMSRLAGSAPDAAALQTAYGTISSAFTAALGSALPSRERTFQATQTSSETIGDLLRGAADAYEQGDQANAEKLKAAADAMAGCNATTGPGSQGGGAGSAGAGAAGGAGAEMAGQMASQVGQQVGQIAGGIAQSVQGLAQGLTQLPQQIMQGVQGMAGSKGAGSDTTTADEAKDDEARDDEARDEDTESDEKRREDQRGQQSPLAKGDGAQPGRGAEQGRPPEPPPVPERPQPAQTRPQQSPV